MRLRWKILIGFAASVAVALAWLLFPRPAQRKWLIEAAWAEERATDFRTSHVAAPLPATFGELLEPALPALHESRMAYLRRGAASMDRVRRIYSGKDPISQLDSEASADLALHHGAMQTALQATHAQFARPPASLRLFAFFGPDESFVDVQQAVKLAALDVLTVLDQGGADEAIEECVDALALGRDVSYPSVLGRVVGVAVTGISAHACGRALSAAPQATVERARMQLAAIRRATPRFADILRREHLFQQLLMADSDAGLPEGARVFIAGARAQNRGALPRLELALFGPIKREGLADLMAELLEAQALGWPDCANRMEQAAARFQRKPIIGEPTGFVSLLRRHRDALLKLDALACAASALTERARTGTLPRDVASTCPPIEPQATCGERSAPMLIVTGAEPPHVSVTLSDGSEFVVPLARMPQASAAALR